MSVKAYVDSERLFERARDRNCESKTRWVPVSILETSPSRLSSFAGDDADLQRDSEEQRAGQSDGEGAEAMLAELGPNPACRRRGSLSLSRVSRLSLSSVTYRSVFYEKPHVDLL